MAPDTARVLFPSTIAIKAKKKENGKIGTNTITEISLCLFCRILASRTDSRRH